VKDRGNETQDQNDPEAQKRSITQAISFFLSSFTGRKKSNDP
jgi:hypothetical protein